MSSLLMYVLVCPVRVRARARARVCVCVCVCVCVLNCCSWTALSIKVGKLYSHVSGLDGEGLYGIKI